MKYLFVFIFYDSAGQLGVACSVNSAVVKKTTEKTTKDVSENCVIHLLCAGPIHLVVRVHLRGRSCKKLMDIVVFPASL